MYVNAGVFHFMFSIFRSSGVVFNFPFSDFLSFFRNIKNIEFNDLIQNFPIFPENPENRKKNSTFCFFLIFQKKKNPS